MLSKKLLVVIFAGVVLAIGISGAVFVVTSSTPEEKAAKFLEKGQLYYDDGEYVSATLEVRNALQRNENLAQGWYILAKIAETRSDFKGVFGMATRAVQIDPNHIQARLLLGSLYLAAKQFDKAREQSDATMELNRNDADVRAFRGSLLSATGDTDEAFVELKRAKEIDPKNFRALSGLIGVYISQKDKGAALNLINEALAIFPERAVFHFLKLSVFEQSADYDATIRVFDNAIKNVANPEYFYRSKVNFQGGLKKSAEALDTFRTFMSSQPENLDLKVQFINLVFRINGADAAESELKKFIAADSENTRLKLTLGRMYQSTGKTDEARKTYSDLIEQHAGNPAALEAKTQLAGVEFSQSNAAAGDKLVEEVLSLEPRNIPALILRAQRSLTLDEIEKATIDLRSVLSEDANNVQGLMLLARAHFRNKSMDLANDRYLQAIVKHPNRLNIRLEYARFLMGQGQFDRVKEALEAILAIQSTNIQALRLMTQMYLRTKDYANAELYRQKAESTGDSVFSQFAQGELLKLEGDFEAGIATYKKLVQSAPSNPQALYSLVRTYMSAGQNENANVFLTNFLASNPTNAMAAVLLGQLALVDKSPDTAAKYFRQAIDANPIASVGYTNLASLNQNVLKDDIAAEKVLREGLSAIPGNLALTLQLASLHEVRSNFDEAMKLYEKIIEINPRVEVAQNNLASLLSERPDPESHQRAVQIATKFRNSSIPSFQDTLAWAYYRTGEFDRALDMATKAVNGDPEEPVFRYHLGMVYLAMNDAVKAKTALQKVIDTAPEKSPYVEKAREALKTIQ